MLRIRLLTAIVGLPALLYLLMQGPYYAVMIFFMLCAGLSAFEAAMMLLPRLDEIYKTIRTTDQPHVEFPRNHFKKLSIFSAALAMMIFFVSIYGESSASRGILVFGLTIAMLFGVFATQGIDAEMARVFGYVVSISYGGLPWIVIWDLYEKGHNAKYVVLLLTIVWASDSGAYFGGRFFGKHKMSPHKSPKKTWEGAAAGFLMSNVGTLIFHYLFPNILGSAWCAVVAASVAGIFGQLGDLVESVLKRFSQVKDSGGIIPGHGGILDRTDGLLTAAPALWFVLYLFSLM